MVKTKTAVIVIDMLEDFVYGALKNERAKRIIPNLAILLEQARKKGWVVIYSNDAHKSGDPEEKVWGKHAMAGTRGAQVIKEIAPQKGDYISPKQNYSAFFETEVEKILKSHGVEEVIIAGQHTHICVRHTSADAFMRGYKIIIPEDCVECFSDRDQEYGLEYLKMCYKAEVVKTADLIGSGK
jgi:nicotinamidase-related amidase